jgi:transcriptional regulator with XRE-family HTH domain
MARSAKPRYLDGKALRRERLKAGLEQPELAEKVGVNQGQVSDWERGYNGCRLGMLHKLAEALGCPATVLMLDEDAAGMPETNGAAA